MFEVLGQLLHRNHRESVSHLQLEKVAHQAGLIEGFSVPFHERIGLNITVTPVRPRLAVIGVQAHSDLRGGGRGDGDLLARKKLHNARIVSVEIEI